MQMMTFRRGTGAFAARHLGPGEGGNALVAGTCVLTLDGVRPVETLASGDRVITRDGGSAELVALRLCRRRVQLVSVCPEMLCLWHCRGGAGERGDGRTDRNGKPCGWGNESGGARGFSGGPHGRRSAAPCDPDPAPPLLLPAGQEVLVRDWRAGLLFGASRALVPAERLVDGQFTRHIGTREVTLAELVFEAPHILYAGGLELASVGEPRAIRGPSPETPPAARREGPRR